MSSRRVTTTTRIKLQRKQRQDIRLNIIIIRHDRYRDDPRLVVQPLGLLQLIEDLLERVHVQGQIHDKARRGVLPALPLDGEVVLHLRERERGGDRGVQGGPPVGLPGLHGLGEGGVAGREGALAVAGGVLDGAIVGIGTGHKFVGLAFLLDHTVLNELHLYNTKNK